MAELIFNLMIVDKINEYLSSSGKVLEEVLLDEVAQMARWSFMRQFGEREESAKTLRLSSIGRCMRQQAYKLLGFPENGKSLDSRAKMVFFQGDMAEMAIVQLAKAAGCNITQYGKDQGEVALNGIVGHPDGILDGEYLVEVKSMSSYGFKEFEQGKFDEGYQYQVNAYMEALGLNKYVAVALNKDAGVLAEGIGEKNPEIVADIYRRIALLKEVKEDTLPERPYAPNALGFYPWNCLYCGFHRTCLPNAEKVLVGKAYKLKEIKLEKEKVI